MIGPDSLPGLLYYEATESPAPTDHPVAARTGVIVGCGGGYLTVVLRTGMLANFDPHGMTVHARLWSPARWIAGEENP
jgi:hypothetical protein